MGDNIEGGPIMEGETYLEEFLASLIQEFLLYKNFWLILK
jgi:hypothetical protein